MTYCKFHGEYTGEITPCCIHAATRDMGIAMSSPMVILKKLTADDVEFSVECLEEHTPVRGNALASGDDAVDKECEDEIINDLNNGNPWAWCTIKVTAKWKSFTGTVYLGCCSYKSEEDFTSEGGYYDDMKDEALEELRKGIEEAYGELKELQVAVVD